MTSRQVLEALLFVGGKTLPSRQLADVLSGSTSSEDVLRWIDELNALYDSECRPYRIELVEGGHRMQLRSEFEKVRHRVYGFGPREVKLSQEVLEILSFIAYSQPVSEDGTRRLGARRNFGSRTTTASPRVDSAEAWRPDRGPLRDNSPLPGGLRPAIHARPAPARRFCV